MPSGIGPMRSDEYRIDPADVAAFVEALLARRRRTTHGVMIALSDGFLATVPALAARAGTEGRPGSGRPRRAVAGRPAADVA
ncbi:hypothetical protein GCM10010211_27730 [Streptomyces albospinus]|uniref:Uncharacterized protein n=2 Tax=Streptomyces albospinus TaxID=285515 RepID=A0ABQ2V0G6_9ACTN|nr:hypothetical protein GCM10010211_27730 [Streptomyces albospinus]